MYKSVSNHSKSILDTMINIHLTIPDLDLTGMDTMILYYRDSQMAE